MNILGLDIGGSSVKAAIIDTDNLAHPVLQRLPSAPFRALDFEAVKAAVISQVQAALSLSPALEYIGISTTGAVDAAGIVMSAGHFKNYVNIDWNEILTREFHSIAGVYVTNDGRASAWAEFMARGPELRNFIYFVIGTGVGSACIVDRKIVTGENGVAGYLGHIKVLDDSDIICSCGKTGCVETVSAGPAVVRRINALNGAGYPNLKAAVSENNNRASAAQAFYEAGYALGKAASGVVNALNPGVVSVGGGVLLAADMAMDKADHINPYLKGFTDGVNEHAYVRVLSGLAIEPARFGNDSGAIGAALGTAAVYGAG